MAAISNAAGLCPHCTVLRNMRAIRTTKSAGMDREIIITHHCETCGFFVENETVRPSSWDELINSLDKFSAEFLVERNQPKLRDRSS